MNYGYACLLGNLDMTLFRQDVPAEKIRDLIIWALENYGNRSLELIGDQKVEDIDVEALNADFDAYLDVLRKCFYKQ